MDQLTLFAAEAPVRPSQSQGCDMAWLTRADASCSSTLPSLAAIVPAGLFGKMCPESCHFTEGKRSKRFSGGFKSSGIMHHGECLTLNMCEWTATLMPFPTEDRVSSLSDILETGAIPPKYFLSPKACAGILRRADKRAKAIPNQMRTSLEAVASQA